MSIEAMKLALEALENWLEFDPENFGATDNRAVTALHQAIEQAEKQEPMVYDKTEMNCFVQELYDRKMQEGKRGHYETMFHCVHQAIKRLYTTPQPKHEWVGLTDEEIALVCAECSASAHNWNDISFAHAIEAKLKDKNHVS